MANLKAQKRIARDHQHGEACTALYEKGLHAKLGADGKYIFTHKNGASY